MTNPLDCDLSTGTCSLCGFQAEPHVRCNCPEKKPKLEPCQHRGETLRLEDCQSCNGSVRLKVLACSVHSECQIENRLPNVKSCLDCTDYKPQLVPLA